MPNISWNEASPADTDNAGLGDDQIRSLKTSIRVGLGGEHVWPASGGDAGVHLPGSARAAFGPQSTVSSTGTDGRLFWASDTSSFYHVGSGGTSYIGGATAISLGTYPGVVPQRHQWVEEVGEVLCNGALITVTYPNSGYSGLPFVTFSLFTDGLAGTRAVTGGIVANSATNFQVRTFALIGSSPAMSSPSNATMYWRSLGTRVL